MRNLLITFMALGITACSNGYQMYYHQRDGATPEAIAATRVGVPPATPLLEHTPERSLNSTFHQYNKRGYRMIGYSLYHSPGQANDNSALEQAKHVNADLVVILPTSDYTNYKFTNNCCAKQITNYGALFFVKYRFPLGLIYRELDDKEKQKIQSNHGIEVVDTVDYSPAFNADIIPGDIITAIDDKPMFTSTSLDGYIKSHNNSTIKITISREGNIINKFIYSN